MMQFQITNAERRWTLVVFTIFCWLAATGSARAQGTVLFSDDFNRTTGLGSNWAVQQGSFTTDGNFAVGGTMTGSGTGNWAAVVPVLNTNDYSVSADLIVPAGSMFSGVVARSNDSLNFDRTLYAAQIATDGTVNLYRRNDWAWALLASTSAGIVANTSYNLRLVVSGASPVHLEAWVNNVQKIVFDDSSASQITTGIPGMENYDTGVTYDNFTVTSPQAPPPPPTTIASNHVYVVVLENQSYSSVIGNTSMPNLNNMANTYALATNYFANTHPSIGNYFEMTTGQIITNNDGFTATVAVDNLARHLTAAGKTWKEYSEDIPNVGYTGGDAGLYIEHHNPFSYFSDVRGTAQANNLVPFTQLQADLNAGTLPNFGFIVPNNCDNAHDCAVSTADTWLQNNVFVPLLNSAPFQPGGDGLLVVVFDESFDTDTANGGGQVAAVLIGPNVKRAYRSVTFYQHQSLLLTINDLLGLTSFVAPSDAATAPSMAEFF